VAEGESQNLNIAMLDRQLLHLIDTIVANPQALIWILNTESVASIAKQQANYCVRAAIWASILGRQLGMSRNDMKVLFQGTLLADIGMNLLPQRLVSKRGPFRRKEFLVYIKHVELGLEILSGQTALDTRVAGIVR
jgi:HD-GYP domain-containing protein (c-di-GMP phosphodiesterase class II)